MNDQSIARQRLSKHVKTHATIEIRVFIARCWARSSATMTSLASTHVTYILCGQRRDCYYALIR
jgi:predicted deacetylase